MKTLVFPALAALALLATGAGAQDERALREALEGRMVAPRLDMPATTGGVNVFPAAATALDPAEVQRDIARYGVGAPRGKPVQVTRIKVKGKHIEFQLGRGGESQKPTRSSSYVPQSRAEKRLRDQLDETKDPAERKRLKEQIRDLEDARRREQERLNALAEATHGAALARHSEEEWALMAGARFNVRFTAAVPPSVLTPEGLMAAMAEWVDFDPPLDALPGDGPALAELSKGMSVAEVEAAFGAPESCSDSDAAGLTVTSCEYRRGESRLQAQFVDGVLVRYTLSSQ